MPAKATKKAEGEPDTAPRKAPLLERSLGCKSYVADLLQLAKDGDVAALLEQVASAVACPAHAVDNLQSITADFHFENVMFASTRGWGAEKAKSFLADMDDLYTLTRASDDVCELKLLFKKLMLSHRATALKICPDSHDISLPHPPPPPQTPRTPLVQAAGSDAGDDSAVQADPAPHLPVFFTLDDIAAVTEHITGGLMQHYALYHMVLTSERLDTVSAKKAVTVPQPASPQPLSTALTEDVYQQRLKDKEEGYQAAVAGVRAQEDAARQAEAAERQRAQEAEEEVRAKEEEERAAQLTLDNEEAAAVVEAVRSDIRQTLQQRQAALLERLQRMEEDVAALG